MFPTRIIGENEVMGNIEKYLLDFCRDVSTLEPVLQIVDDRIYLFKGPKYSVRFENLMPSEIRFVANFVMTKIKTEDGDPEFGFTAHYWSIPIKYVLRDSARVDLILAFFACMHGNILLSIPDRETKKEQIESLNFRLRIFDRLQELQNSKRFSDTLQQHSHVIETLKHLTGAAMDSSKKCLEYVLKEDFEFE